MKIDLILATVNDHRDIEIIERLIYTIKQRLACITVASKDTNFFNTKTSPKSII